MREMKSLKMMTGVFALVIDHGPVKLAMNSRRMKWF